MRRIEMLNGAGQVVGMVNIGDGEVPAVHMPFYAGAVTWREVDPAVITAEIATRIEEERLQNALLHGIAVVLLRLYRSNFDQENRLRALEGQPARTLAQYEAHNSTLVSPTVDQFKQALRAILGI